MYNFRGNNCEWNGLIVLIVFHAAAVSRKILLFGGIEGSLRAFASMRAVCLFWRARAVINFLMGAAKTLQITNGEQRALRKFFASWNLSSIKTLFCAK